MSRVFILPYKMGSEGAKALASELACNRLYNDSRSKYRYRAGDMIINWGSVDYSRSRRLSIIPIQAQLNIQRAIANATNKLKAFELFDLYGVPTCEWTPYANVALVWKNTDGAKVFARKVLHGKCGDGIVICEGSETPLVPAPLYTKHFNSKREYRVHVVNGVVIDHVKKGKRRDREVEPDPLIRNHENGWVFMRDGIELPSEVGEAAIKAVSALGLDFGAVDIGWRDGVCAVFECNTSPGMEASTITTHKYANAFRRLTI